MNNHKEYAQHKPVAEQARSELRRIRYKREYLYTLKSTLFAFLLAAALILSAVAYLPVIRITGDSMADTLRNGDVLIVLRGDDVQRGDLIAFYVEGGKMLVKRAVAVAGDNVQIDQDGAVTVNGYALDEKYVSVKSLGQCDIEFPFEVPHERVFVLGDNRELSVDSRSTAVGCIAREQIIGRAALRVWPLNAFGLLDFKLTE